ncbi:MAG: hypothetical protein JOZ43_08820 [Acidobacteriales bacterium]|nr:hypothetical protein [Terriglobales bacterium]
MNAQSESRKNLLSHLKLIKLLLVCVFFSAIIMPALMQLYLITQRPQSPEPGSGRVYEVNVSVNATRYLDIDEMERFERTRIISMVLRVVCLTSFAGIWIYDRALRRSKPMPAPSRSEEFPSMHN